MRARGRFVPVVLVVLGAGVVGCGVVSPLAPSEKDAARVPVCRTVTTPATETCEVQLVGARLVLVCAVVLATTATVCE